MPPEAPHEPLGLLLGRFMAQKPHMGHLGPPRLARQPQSLARQPQSLAQQPQSLAQQPQSLAQQQLWRQQELWRQQQVWRRARGCAARVLLFVLAL